MISRQTLSDTAENILTYLKNKPTPYILTVGLVAAVLTGCKDIKTELSDRLHDEAIVEKHTAPEKGQFNWGIAAGNISAAVILDAGEYPHIIFQGKKTRFKFVGDTELFRRFNAQDATYVTYREVYSLTYDDLDSDGKKEVINKVLMDYTFLDAQLKK